MGKQGQGGSFLKRVLTQPAISWRLWPDDEFFRWDGLKAGEAIGLAQTRRLKRRLSLRELFKKGTEKELLKALDNFLLEEVILLLQEVRASAALLSLIGARAEWSRHPKVARLLCMNPRTPYHISHGLVGQLSIYDLKELTRSSQLLPQLVNDAKKTLLSKERLR